MNKLYRRVSRLIFPLKTRNLTECWVLHDFNPSTRSQHYTHILLAFFISSLSLSLLSAKDSAGSWTMEPKGTETKDWFIKVTRPSGVQFGLLSYEWLTRVQKELDNTKSRNQLIKTMTKFEKETVHRLYVFPKKKQLTLQNETTAHVHDAFCPLTQAWRVNCPFNCPITLSSYKRTLAHYSSNRASDTTRSPDTN